MKSKPLEKKRLPFEIPPGPEAEERRRNFKKIQQDFGSDPALAEEHNTCATSEVDLRAVKFDVKDDDLILSDPAIVSKSAPIKV